jgi:hypothetical protein
MQRISVAFCIAILAILNACSDSTSGPASPSDRLRPAGNVTLQSCAEFPREAIEGLINDVFGAGSVDANSALGKWQNIQKQIADGNTAEAENKTWALVKFMVDKQESDKLPASEAFAELVRSLFCAAGINAGIPAGSNAWIVEPEDPEKILITSDGNAGVKIPASAVDNTSIISITASNDTLNTMLDKYNVQTNGTEAPTYQFSKYPSNVFSSEVVVSVCAVAEEALLDELVLGHNIGGPGFEILDEETSFLSCTLNASNTQPSMLDRVFAFMLPTIAYAAGPGASGIGGSTVEFSPIGPVDPRINVTKNASGASAPIGSAVSPAPSVSLATPNGTALANIPVAFAIVSGGGSITPASVNSAATTGVAASTEWRMGLTPGANSASATPGLGGPAVAGVLFIPTAATFNATATGPSAIVLSGGPSGTYTAGSTLPTTTATVVDADGRTVEGFTGTINLSANPGPIASGTTSQAAVAGSASFSNTVINKSDTHTLSVSTTYGATNLSDAGDSFVITPGSASSLTINGGNNQTVLAGSVLGVAPLVAPSVLVTDSYGNPVSGASVYWLPGGVSGALTPSSPTTNALGIASATWSILPGVNEMIASLDPAPGTAGRFQAFTATGTISTTPLASCGPGNQRDPIAGYFARMDGINKTITDARFFFSVNGSANVPSPYDMRVTARVRASNGTVSVYQSSPTTMYLRGNNAETKEVNFKFPTGIVSGGGTKIVFEISSTTATNNTISFNAGDCPPGSKCGVKPACPVVEVPTTNSFLSTPYRQSFGIRIYGY